MTFLYYIPLVGSLFALKWKPALLWDYVYIFYHYLISIALGCIFALWLLGFI